MSNTRGDGGIMSGRDGCTTRGTPPRTTELGSDFVARFQLQLRGNTVLYTGRGRTRTLSAITRAASSHLFPQEKGNGDITPQLLPTALISNQRRKFI